MQLSFGISNTNLQYFSNSQARNSPRDEQHGSRATDNVLQKHGRVQTTSHHYVPRRHLWGTILTRLTTWTHSSQRSLYQGKFYKILSFYTFFTLIYFLVFSFINMHEFLFGFFFMLTNKIFDKNFATSIKKCVYLDTVHTSRQWHALWPCTSITRGNRFHCALVAPFAHFKLAPKKTLNRLRTLVGRSPPMSGGSWESSSSAHHNIY